MAETPENVPGHAVMFGLPFQTLTMDEAVHAIINSAKHGKKKIVVTPNVDHIVMMKKKPELLVCWAQGEFIFADGMPLVWLSRFLPGPRISERVTGADLMPALCAEAAKAKQKVMIVGGGPGVAETAKTKLEAKFPAIKIVGLCCPPFGYEKDPESTQKLISEINRKAPDLLFLCTGTPKSEQWLHEHAEELDFGVALSVGAAVDFMAGNIRRAPEFVRNLGFEWLWRLLQEPRRLWKRYLVQDSQFLFYAVKEILDSRRVQRKA